MIELSKRLSITIALAVIVTTGAVTASITQNNKSNRVEFIKVAGDLADVFNNLDQLKQKSSAIIEVNILETETIVYNDMPFTISKAKVISKVKGKINEGEDIKLIETGGKYTLSGTNPKEVKGQEVEWAFEGVRVMQPGEHLFLFVEEFVGPQIKDAYIPLGIYQGKFKVNKDGNVNQQAPSDHKLKDYIKPVNVKEFKEKLK